MFEVVDSALVILVACVCLLLHECRFALTIVNNWPIIMEGYVVAVATHWAMLFFYVWYFAIVVVVLNIVTAFLIDDFTVMRAQIVDDNTGYAPLWCGCVQLVCHQPKS